MKKLDEHSRLVRFIEKQLACDLNDDDNDDNDDNNGMEPVELGGNGVLYIGSGESGGRVPLASQTRSRCCLQRSVKGVVAESQTHCCSLRVLGHRAPVWKSWR